MKKKLSFRVRGVDDTEDYILFLLQNTQRYTLFVINFIKNLKRQHCINRCLCVCVLLDNVLMIKKCFPFCIVSCVYFPYFLAALGTTVLG
jgi:hypothetical protein